MSRFLFALLVVFALASCRTMRPPLSPATALPAAARPPIALFIETNAPGGRAFVLPQSGVEVTCDPRPIAGASDLEETSLITLELGRALSVRVNASTAAAITERTAGAANPRLVLVIDEEAVGLVRAGQMRADRRISFFVEKSDAELLALASRLEANGVGEHRGAALHP